MSTQSNQNPFKEEILKFVGGRLRRLTQRLRLNHAAGKKIEHFAQRYEGPDKENVRSSLYELHGAIKDACSSTDSHHAAIESHMEVAQKMNEVERALGVEYLNVEEILEQAASEGRKADGTFLLQPAIRTA